LELFPGERGSAGDVGAALRDAAVGEFGNSWAGEADIDDFEFCLMALTVSYSRRVASSVETISSCCSSVNAEPLGRHRPRAKRPA
jgi:hypothetical protein